MTTLVSIDVFITFAIISFIVGGLIGGFTMLCVAGKIYNDKDEEQGNESTH